MGDIGDERPHGMVTRVGEKMAELPANHEAAPLSEAQEVEMTKVTQAKNWGKCGRRRGLNLLRVDRPMNPRLERETRSTPFFGPKHQFIARQSPREVPSVAHPHP